MLENSRDGHDGFSFGNYDYVVPFGIGIRKGFINKYNFQFGVSGSVNTQFLFRNENSVNMNGVRKTHFNSDFYVRLFTSFLLFETMKLRFTLFHRWSHLGDDFLLLNDEQDSNYWSTDEANYEAIQGHYVYEGERFTLYFGGNFVLRSANRKRVEFQQGGIVRPFLKGGIGKKFFLGYDIKMLQNNEFAPSIDAGIGYETGKETHVRLNYFSGNIPFSRLERVLQSSWFGLGFYINVNSI